MDSNQTFAPRTLLARGTGLGITAHLPEDWTVQEPAGVVPRADDPTAFSPFGVVTAPDAGAVLAFASRTVFADGSLLEHARALLAEGGLTTHAIASDTVAGVPAVVGEGRKASAFGATAIRFALFEDGGRLVHVTMATPQPPAEAVRRVWFAMLRTLRLDDPRGSRFVSTVEPARADAER